MNSEDIKSKVKAIVIDKLNVSAEEVVPTAHFVNDLGADSLDRVELVLEFEKEFDLKIGDDQASTLQTVGSVIEFLENHLSQHKG
ncbi:acyl carrier protein [Cardinium endosymbiont of Culicoides punctatus]|uniref:acyl carrier protein n=1 Tax=Cardinium endosymbiont of Culicoides punctatus TaxID=2304601 RepID=UPI001058FBC0|nr:acyl carrier protein [Cardinium endosymbiont of Culicoides punctatus]TDG94970.1 Acyl carrier protein AcpP [Cardinium endosymbiont of Culicoides punctatus]